MIGVAIFGAKLTDLPFETGQSRIDIAIDYLSWAWYLGLAAAILCVKASIFLTIGVCATINN